MAEEISELEIQLTSTKFKDRIEAYDTLRNQVINGTFDPSIIHKFGKFLGDNNPAALQKCLDCL
jgi:hypothetical protein